jgi:hypothetical protein
MLPPRLVMASTCVLLAGATASSQDRLRSDAASMTKKLAAIVAHGAVPARGSAVVRTSFTDRELNAYFKVAGPELMPVGLATPEFVIDAGGKVAASSVVDLTAIRNAKPRAWGDPLAYVGGSMPVTVAGVLQATNGRGSLVIERATLGGVPIPPAVLQELVSYYSRTPESPQGVDLSRPFELPANIRSIETRRGAATIVQSK